MNHFLFQEYYWILRGMSFLNLFCGVTSALYFLIRKEHRFFDIAAVLWFAAMICNMLLVVDQSRQPVFAHLMLILPPVFMLVKGMLAVHTDGPGMSIGLHFCVVAYFLFGAWYARYLGAENAVLVSQKGPGIAGWISYLLLFVILWGLFFNYYYYAILSPSLSMSRPVIQMFTGYRIFFSFAMLSSGIGLVMRLFHSGVQRPAHVILILALGLSAVSLIPSFAAFGSAKNANAAYERFFGEDDFSFSYYLP